VIVLAAALGAGATAAAADHGPAAAVTFQVNSFNDSHDAHPGDGRCADSVGVCSLRAAIEEASAEPAGTTATILLQAGQYSLTLGSLDFMANTIAVTGAGRFATIVTGPGNFRLAIVRPGAVVTLRGMMLTGGNAGQSGYGGAVLNAGHLTVASAMVTDNSAAAGGGLANSGGSLTVVGSEVSVNDALFYGGAGIQNGGLRNLPGTVKIVGSTIDANTAGGDGGGILNGQNGHPAGGGRPAVPPAGGGDGHGGDGHGGDGRGGGGGAAPAGSLAGLRLVVINSKIVGNISGNGGGGIANDGGTAIVEHSTLANDSAFTSVGGGISSSGSLTVVQSALTGDRSCYGGGIDASGFGLGGVSAQIVASVFTHDTGCIGGALNIDSTTVDIVASTFDANSAPSGAAIEVDNGTLSMINSTVAGSTAGPALATYACGSGTIAYSTFAGNSRGLLLSCPDVTLTATIVASLKSAANCAGAHPVETVGYNLDSGHSCGFTARTDQSGVRPLLGRLGAHGGPAPTVPLLAGSPAIDHGGTPATGCPPVDERGFVRPWGPACDVGAFEKEYPLPPGLPPKVYHRSRPR
jgi:CSLREA domain-containing protein